MFQRLRFCVFALLTSAVSLFAQTHPAPPSLADLDGGLKKTAAQIGQRLSVLQGAAQTRIRISVGSFIYQGSDTALGTYWTQSLIAELSNRPFRPFTLVTGDGQADYTLNGEITEISNSVRVFTQLIKMADISIGAVWHTDLEKTEFLMDALDTGRGDSSRRSSVPRDSYEPDSRENPLTVEIGGDWISRSLHSDDEDWFAVTPAAAGMLILETGGDMDTYMELYDEDGEEIDSNDDGGDDANAVIEFFAEAGKRYIAKVQGYSGDSGRYRFRARIEAFNDMVTVPNNSKEDAFPITLGEAVSTFFNADDVDWFQVEIPAGGGQLLVYTEGRLDTTLTLYDQEGNEIANDDDSGSDFNARLSLLVSPGTVYIKVEKYDEHQGRGTYTLYTRLREAMGADQYEPDNSSSQAKPIGVGETQRRTFTGGDDADWVSLTIGQRGVYMIRAQGEDSSDLDTYLELFDVDEQLIAEDDDGGGGYTALLNAELEPGTYFIKVHTLDDDPQEAYLLSVEAE